MMQSALFLLLAVGVTDAFTFSAFSPTRHTSHSTVSKTTTGQQKITNNAFTKQSQTYYNIFHEREVATDYGPDNISTDVNDFIWDDVLANSENTAAPVSDPSLPVLENLTSQTRFIDVDESFVTVDNAALDAIGVLSDDTNNNYNNNENTSASPVSEEGSSKTTSDVDIDLLGVSAVLAASKEAMEAAEATMTSDVDIGDDVSDSSFAEVMPKPTMKQNNNKNNTMSTGTVAEPSWTQEVKEIIPASVVVGEPSTSKFKFDVPTTSKILKFAVPAIGVWLCGPLLSLIDTSAVGVLSGTAQQAALNPAVAVTEYAALLIAFMYTGTTNLMAAAKEGDRYKEGNDDSANKLIGALQLSTFVGAGLGTILFVFARSLLSAMIGNDSIGPEVFSAALKYVRIRALGMPAAAAIGTAQAACLGMQDIKSPLYVLVAAAVVNFFGDILFVGSPHRLIGGAAGAAWATVFSQYAAITLFIQWLTTKPKESSKPRVMNLTKNILAMTGKQSFSNENDNNSLTRMVESNQSRVAKSSTGLKIGNPLSGLWKSSVSPKKKKVIKAKNDSFSVRGMLKDKLRFRDLLKPPSKSTRDEFSPYLLPVTSTQVGRVSGYVAMGHVVASSLGTISMAAQQVVISLFYCLCPIADSLSLTAQSFLPGISEKAASKERADAIKKTTKNFYKAGGIFGSLMVSAVAMIPLLSGFFTTDPQVIALVNKVVPLLGLFFGVHGLLCSAEGLLLGQKDLGFLGKMYAVFFAALPYFMLRVKQAALTGSRFVDLSSVWRVFLCYQFTRVGLWLARVVMLQRRTDANIPKSAFHP